MSTRCSSRRTSETDKKSRSSCSSTLGALRVPPDELAELGIRSNVVLWIVVFRREDEQDRVVRVAVLRAPDQRRHEHTNVGTIQCHFAPMTAIVEKQVARAVEANDELVAFLMRMLPANFPRGHVVHGKIALRSEWYFPLVLPCCELAA